MQRFAIVLLGVCFVLLLCSERGLGDDPIADKLEKAKEKYDKDMKKLSVDVDKYFKKEEEKALKTKMIAPVDKVLEQRKAFEDSFVLPDTAPADLKKQLTAAQKTLMKAYDDAIAAYVTAKNLNLARAVEKEKKERENKGVVLEAKFIPLRKAAEKLHPWVTLELQIVFGGGPGNTKTVKKTEQLPVDGFVITGIYHDLADVLPDKFADEIFLPAITELTTLKNIDVELEMTDDQILQLSKLPCVNTLNALWIRKYDLTSAGIDALKKFTNLKWFACLGKSTDDKLLGRLKELPPRLTYLQLDGLGRSGMVTQKGLQNLKDLRVTNMHLGGSTVSSELIQHLPPILEGIDIGWCAIGDDDLKNLAKYPKLEGIRIPSTKVTDAGLAHLLNCKRLTNLDLDNTAITDDGLMTLAKIRTLKTVWVKKTQITVAGANKAAMGRPDLKIVFEGWGSDLQKK